MSDRLEIIERLGAAIATADGETKAVLREALAALVEATGELAALERRRARDRQRKSAPSVDSVLPALSTVSTVSTVSSESAESSDSDAPPQVSSSFPGPHITSSFPPSDLPTVQPADARVLRRRDAVGRFLAGKDATAMAAWNGRLLAAEERDGFTWDEVTDALEELMASKPREDWTPVVFRAYLGRLRRAKAAETGRDEAAGATVEVERVPRGTRAQQRTASEAADALSEVRALVEVADTPGQGRRRYIRQPRLEALGEWYVRAVQRVGGIARILAVEEAPENIGFLLRDWEKQWEDRPGRAS